MYPPETYADKVECRGRTICDSLRVDYISVKNLNINNPLHLQEVDSFVAKYIAENYAEYSIYQIRILKYKKIMRNVCEDGWGSGKWYSMWYSEYGQLCYSWKYGEFVKRLNISEFDEFLKKEYPK